jgi:cell division protein ZapA
MFAHVTIKILEKEYHVACPAEEKGALLASAELLNAKMREIRDSGKVVGLDRVAVMAALNLANELIRTQAQDEELKNIVGLRIRAMREHLDSALGPAKQLSL